MIYKTVEDLVKGDPLYIYFKGLNNIETVTFSKRVYSSLYVSNPLIQNGEPYELYGKVSRNATLHDSHYTNLSEAQTEFIKDIKNDITSLKHSRDLINDNIKLLSDKIKQLSK